MPHYTDQDIETANSVNLVSFLNFYGENPKKLGSQYLWEKHQVWINENQWYRLEKKICHINDEKMEQIDDAVLCSLGIYKTTREENTMYY